MDETDKASSIANSTTNLNEPPDFKPEISKEGNGVGVAGIAGSIKSTSLEDRTDNKAQSETSQEKSQNSASLRTCLFCNYISPTMSLNLTHMGKYHGTFIPEKDYLVDLEGLVQYLGDKVWTLHECLYCGKARRTAEGAQTHMRDSGHCMIAFTEEHEMLDIGQFYDFRSTYPGLGGSEVDDDDDDDEEATGRNAGVKLGAHRQEIVTVENGGTAAAAPTDGDNGDEEGWESDSSLSSVPTEEITSVPISDHTHRYKMLSLHRHHSHSDPRPHRNPDGWHSHAHHLPHAVYHDDYELHLPSGRTAGHRSLARYYRQNLHNYPTVAERREQLRIANASSSDEGGTVGDLWRGRQLTKRTNAEMSLVGLSDARKKELRAGEKKDLKKAQRLQSKYQWGNEKRANHQKHFRVSDGPHVIICLNRYQLYSC